MTAEGSAAVHVFASRGTISPRAAITLSGLQPHSMQSSRYRSRIALTPRTVTGRNWSIFAKISPRFWSSRSRRRYSAMSASAWRHPRLGARRQTGRECRRSCLHPHDPAQVDEQDLLEVVIAPEKPGLRHLMSSAPGDGSVPVYPNVRKMLRCAWYRL